MTEWGMRSRRGHRGSGKASLPLLSIGTFLLIACCAFLSRAQEPTNRDLSNNPSGNQPTQQAKADSPDGSATGSDDQYQAPPFQIEIQDVTVPVTVTNSAGEFVSDLNPNEIKIIDNGAPQQVENFELSWEPVSMVIVAETSTRVQDQLAEIGRSGILFTQLILGESGEAAVITFGRDINLTQDFTTNADVIEGTLKKLKTSGDDARLSDAVSRALELLARRPKDRRKIIVILSEARDIGNSNPIGLVLRGAQQLGVSIYTVGLSSTKSMFDRPGSQAGRSPYPPGVVVRPTPGNTPPTPSNQSNLGAANLDVLPIIAEMVSNVKNVLRGSPLSLYAQGTGAVEFSGNDKENLEKALERIGREVRSQYLVTYRPNNLDKPIFHSIQAVVTRSGLRVRTSPGYMYPGKGAKSPSSPAPPSASESSQSPGQSLGQTSGK